MKHDQLCMSFTVGSLFRLESIKLAELFLVEGHWNAVREKVLSDNILQARTVSTTKRICREIIARLKTLNLREMDLLVQGASQDQGYILWIAICRCYSLVADFAIEVVRERFLSLKYDLQNEDFDYFFGKKADQFPELDKIQPATIIKLRQVLFRILREADLLSANNTIVAASLSPPLLEVICNGNTKDLLFFPAFESELVGIARRFRISLEVPCKTDFSIY